MPLSSLIQRQRLLPKQSLISSRSFNLWLILRLILRQLSVPIVSNRKMFWEDALSAIIPRLITENILIISAPNFAVRIMDGKRSQKQRKEKEECLNIIVVFKIVERRIKRRIKRRKIDEEKDVADEGHENNHIKINGFIKL